MRNNNTKHSLKNFLKKSYSREKGITNAVAFVRGIYNRFLPYSNRISWKTWESIIDRDLMHDQRIRFFSEWIDDEDRTVVDLGCGKRLIESLLPKSCQYIPVDYQNRGARTVVCDFNKKEYPEVRADVVLMISVLQWIDYPLWLIEEACSHCNEKILFHYITPCNSSDSIIRLKREGEGIKNHLSPVEIISEFNSHGFVLLKQSRIMIKNNRYELFLIFYKKH